MFNVRVTFDADPVKHFKDMAAFFRTAETALLASAQQAHEVTAAPTITDLSFEPPKPKQVVYLHDRQRRAAAWRMRTLGNGPPYTRTHRYSKGWAIIPPVLLEHLVRTVLENPTVDGTGIPYPLYVGGSIDPQDAGNHQQPFHRETGWPPTAPLVARWVNETIALTFLYFQQRMAEAARVEHQSIVYEGGGASGTTAYAPGVNLKAAASATSPYAKFTVPAELAGI